MAESRAPEFEPPLAPVKRIIKSVLPDNILLTKDAVAAFVRAAGIFIFYLTHCSNDFCKENKRQTIFPQDVMNALKELGFEDFEEPLLDFMEKYKRDTDKKKSSKLKEALEGAANVNEAAGEEADENQEENDDIEEDEEPHDMDEE